DKIIVKIPPKRCAMTSLRTKPSHVTLRANQKQPHPHYVGSGIMRWAPARLGEERYPNR
ncbi:hypothetical protein AVEN_129748-1, partial [Araneus ventricosus]